MNAKLRNMSVPVGIAALTLAGILSTLSAGATEKKSETISTEVSEALTSLSVRSKLVEKLGADALRIDVSFTGETATLTGEVAKAPSQKLAEEVALSVKGVKKVDNKVTQKVPEGTVDASETAVKNLALALKVKGILIGEIGTNALKIDVEAADGVVSLRGKLDKPDTAKAALKKIGATKGVKKVVNLLS
ncbi:MAG: BON domain-containing protein [Holophagales bacterium]|jgi:osmotically-inducible protein OsmY|nr:BON domain-containing protein [Holophagales bacterium]MBK9964079.1 BON domain-containing protein [Holophagales bacterium]